MRPLKSFLNKTCDRWWFGWVEGASLNDELNLFPSFIFSFPVLCQTQALLQKEEPPCQWREKRFQALCMFNDVEEVRCMLREMGLSSDDENDDIFPILEFEEGDLIILNQQVGDLWCGSLNGVENSYGYFPSSYVKEVEEEEISWWERRVQNWDERTWW